MNPAGPPPPEPAALDAGALVHTILQSVGEGVVVYDRELRYRLWNRFMEELTGLAAAEVLGRPALELFPHLRAQGVDQLLHRALRGETVRSSDTPYRVPATGRTGWVVGQYSPHRAADGSILGVVGVIHDVTERRRAKELNLRLATVPRESPNPVLECETDGAAVYANPAAERLRAELGAETLRGLLPPAHADLVRSALSSGRRFRNVEVTVGGRILSWTYSPHPPLGVVHLFAEDITGRRDVEEQLRHDALHDPLTGLPNRHLFMERLARAILHAREREDYLFAVLFLDLDRFKVVNDSLGHHVGDDLLAVVARRLAGCLRPEDTVSRFGGDEFAILLTDITGAAAARVAERILGEISAPINLQGYDVFTSASIGIALSSSAYGRPEYLVRNADMAMYRAKAAGKRRVEVFDRAMHAQVLLRLQQETDLRRALQRDELRLFYQPIVDLGSGRIDGVEALVRWEHPDRGWIPPGDFIPTAEETGLIHGIGQWVLEEACRTLQRWRDGRPLTVSVNLSGRQLAQPDLVEQVARTLRDTGADPRGLKLEVTESVVVENPESAAETLRSFRALGIEMYMDDFGTGYSSLSYLHRLPLDALKIDRSFVSRIGVDPEGTVVVRTIATLAHSLGLSVVAEGVETPEQLRILRELGCEYAQGYLFSRPVDAEATRALLETDPRW
ncbi:MAG: EAL domain-containing protein [Gemmatimonadota bacterium]|nr:EAL domain-containing protein [Gemmatimonadota bacterium]